MSDYTIKHIAEVQDVLGDYPGEMRMMTGDLGSEQVAFTYRRMPQHTGGKGSYGHRHKEQEEVYVVLSGSGRIKLDDEIVELREWDSVRIPPATTRQLEAGPDGLEYLAFGAPNVGSGDAEYLEDFWPE